MKNTTFTLNTNIPSNRIKTPFQLRMNRAEQIYNENGVKFECVDTILNTRNYAVTPEGGVGDPYRVSIKFDNAGKLAWGFCTCRDFAKPMQDQGVPTLRGIRVCKHILAASLHAACMGDNLPQEPVVKAAPVVYDIVDRDTGEVTRRAVDWEKVEERVGPNEFCEGPGAF